LLSSLVKNAFLTQLLGKQLFSHSFEIPELIFPVMFTHYLVWPKCKSSPIYDYQ
jgi:hypothetical protein